jgi:CDP-diacylglycerol---serine O-phosphatidyltransferase
MKKHIPNFLTCCHLFCGCVGITFSSGGKFNLISIAAFFVILAAVFDFLDGFAARLLKVTSPIGKELDSLADVVSFGVLPGMILNGMAWHSYWEFVPFLIPVFSALRLAKFNIDLRQTNSFIGVPTPANALLIASFPFISLRYSVAGELFHNPLFVMPFTLLSCFLLVSNIRLMALKFKSFGWVENRFVYIFLGLSLILLLWLQALAVPLIFVLYIGISLIKNRFSPPA